MHPEIRSLQCQVASIVSVKAIHKSLTSKHKTVRNVSVDNMYLFEYKYMHQEYEQI